MSRRHSSRPCSGTAGMVDLKAAGEGVLMGTAVDIDSFADALERHDDPHVSMVLKLPAAVAVGAPVRRVLLDWVEHRSHRPPLALVVPAQSEAAMRSVAMDLAALGVYVGVFSARNLSLAMRHAVRERQIALIDNPQRAARPVAGSAESLGEMKEARAILRRFTSAGRAQRARRPVNFNDVYEVAALELRGKCATDPLTQDTLGAWLYRAKSRGAGSCTPLQGGAEGLHVLVLDAQAVAELWKAASDHRDSVASYAQLQSDLAQLGRLRGGRADGAGGD